MSHCLKLTALLMSVIISDLTNASPVTVIESKPVTMEIAPSLRIIKKTLDDMLRTEKEIGTAIVHAGDKQISAMTETARLKREYDTFGRQTERLERARVQYQVADSICSESVSGVASQVSQQSRVSASKLSRGHGVKNEVIRKTLSGVPATSREGGYRSASLHAAYCSPEEFARYGGTDLCPRVSSMPNGDVEMRSLIDGAGDLNKTPDLTFTQDQIDAAMAYMKNSVRHDVGQTPGKGDIQSTTGKEYQGLMAQYKAIQSASEQPQLDIISASQANPATHEALAETLKSVSAKYYFDAIASKEAKRSGVMSEREFESFQVGRRYANTYYEADLQAMSESNLLRELIRVNSMNNWLLLGIKNEMRKNNVISGQQLALVAEEKYAPQLKILAEQLSAGVTGNAKD